jgi:hypothetical protein
MKNLATSLILLLVVAAIGGWIYFNERGPVSRTGATVLLRAQPQRVSSIGIQAPGSAPLEMTRTKNGWQVHRGGTNSIAVPADDSMIDEVLRSTQLLQSGAVTTETNAEKLKEFGLDTPRGTLTIDNAKIEFGDKARFDPTKVYARVIAQGAPQIALLPASLAEFVTRPFDAWRDKAPLRVPVQDVTTLKIRSPQFTASFERILKGEGGEDDQWRMVAPLQVRADAGTIQALLQQLNIARTPRFLEDNPSSPATWGLEKPFAVIEVGTGGGGGSTLHIGKALDDGTRAAQNLKSPVVFALPPSILQLLARPLADWRDRQLLRFSTQDVQKITVSARGQITTLVKDGAGWKRQTRTSNDVSEKSTVRVSQAAFDIMIGLQGLNANDFVNAPLSLQTYGLNKPAVEITLQSNEWNAPKKIRLASKNGKVFAQIAENDDNQNGEYPNRLAVLPSDALQTFKLAFDALFETSD